MAGEGWEVGAERPLGDGSEGTSFSVFNFSGLTYSEDS